ncbi:PREDICTED: uncharacterized protein LOC102029966 [Chinchilla lanigera]|uniref:uncharacterized protein LOC102029966 n=1 Tax=Chinchilla lanigera TaxID=34839 RepID=UPI000698A57C|nr:PREDICTED: uncharacterized protein LOC102029966 [Chinchilla lanigera]
MESGEALSTGAGVAQAALHPPEAHTVPPGPLTMLIVVVEVELGRGSGPEEIQSPLLLLEEPNSLHLPPWKMLESQERCLTFDRVLGIDAAQEAEQELLARIQSTLASVGRGYSVALILRGRETEAPRLVPQLLQVLFEEALLLHHPDCMLSTLSLVQISPNGKTQDLLSPGLEDLSVLEVAPLGLVVEGASEVEVSDSRAASELYLQATGREGRTCHLLTLTISCPGPDPPEETGTQGVWRGALRILQLPGALDCPLLRVLAGEVVGAEMEGSLPWIISRLLEGNNYAGLLLRLYPQGSSLSLLQGALLGASRRRMQVKQVRPILWDAVEEAQARRAGLKTLRSGLLGKTLTDERLSQLGRALRELQVVKAWSQYPRSPVPKGARAEVEKLPEPQVQGKPPKYCKQRRQHCSHLSVAGRRTSLGPALHQKHSLRNSEEQACGAPDVALQFLLAQAQRQRLQEQHQIWIQEEWKRLGQEVAGKPDTVQVAEKQFCGERQKRLWEQTVLRLQVEALRAERDTAEQDLAALYDLHVQATRAQTCHMLQVFRAWQGLWEKKATTTEHHLRSLLADVLQDTIHLASQTQELQAQNQQLQLQQCASKLGTVTLDPCPGEKPGDQ